MSVGLGPSEGWCSGMTTRDQFITAATQVFAARGFYGASIASIADALQLTKQALLHHFGSKEKLYAEVLKRISERLMLELETSRSTQGKPAAQLEAFMVAFYRSSYERREETQLLMRELLDNKRRAETARSWYLKPFVQTLTSMLKRTPRWRRRSDAATLACVYQLLGAVNYFAVSEPTLTQMLGKRAFVDMQGAFESELRTLVRLRVG